MGETICTVEELVAEGNDKDVTWIYEEWREELAKLLKKVTDRFELNQDPSTKGLEVEGEIGLGVHGQVQCFAGPEIDWMVYSWMADPKRGFANLHLTISPGAHVDLPIFGMAFAVFGPYPWAYVDYGARRDMATNPAYHDKYYGVVNDHWLDLRRKHDELDMRWFTSPSSYIRAVCGPGAFCYSGPMNNDMVSLIKNEANFYLDTWLGFWDNANEVPVDERPAMSQYTEDWRRSIAQGDPANSVAEALFGPETTDLLVSTLWGRDRVLPRAMGK